MNKEQQEIRSGKDAERILNDPLIQKAFINIESGIIGKMRIVPMGDIDTQHELVLTLQLLDRFKRTFTEAFQTGEMAKSTLAERLKKRIGR